MRTMKYTIKLNQDLPFSNCPTLAELEGEKIVCNDVQLPVHIDANNSYNPYNVRAMVIGNEYGAICVVFASHAQEALDNAVNSNMLDSLMSSEEQDEYDSLTPLGNASELFDLSNVWIGEVDFEAARDINLIVALVRAQSEGDDTLS